MNLLKYLGLAAVAGIFLTVTAPKMDAQVAVSVGPAPVCPYGYYDVLLIPAPLTVITARSGFLVASSSALALGFTVTNTFGVT
jgi:hypothetical protein